VAGAWECISLVLCNEHFIITAQRFLFRSLRRRPLAERVANKELKNTYTIMIHKMERKLEINQLLNKSRYVIVEKTGLVLYSQYHDIVCYLVIVQVRI
jgi:hypothetical protein